MSTRVITAAIPAGLAEKLDELASRMDRSRSWIMKRALSDWIVDEEERYRLTLEALADVDEGRTISQEEMVEHIRSRAARRQDS
jgi:predicted transcriptional regulator